MNLIKEPYEISLWKDELASPLSDEEKEQQKAYFYQGSSIDYLHPILIDINLSRNEGTQTTESFTQMLLDDFKKGDLSIKNIYEALSNQQTIILTAVLPCINYDLFTFVKKYKEACIIKTTDSLTGSIGGPGGSNYEINTLKTYKNFTAQLHTFNNEIVDNNIHSFDFSIDDEGNSGLIIQVAVFKNFLNELHNILKVFCIDFQDGSDSALIRRKDDFPFPINWIWDKNYFSQIETIEEFDQYDPFINYCLLNNINYDKILIEKLVTKLGSNTSSSLNRPMQPKFVDNLNGSHTLTFTLYDKYIDPFTNEQTHNPFIDMIKNESKIKIKLKDKWYDFVVKQINSSSDKKTYVYTCRDQYINELSKQGYNVEFDAELMNNIDTADKLASTAVKESGWEVKNTKEGSDVLIETHDEPLLLWENGEYNYIPYSAYQNKLNKFYGYKLTNPINSETDINDEYVVTIKDFATDLYSDFEWDNIDISITPYYGRIPQKGNLYKYDPITEKVVQEYSEKISDIDRRDFYAYTENEFISPTLVSNYVANGSNFSSTSGWNIDKGGSVSLGWRESSWRLDNDGKKVNYPVLTCRFPDGSLLKNIGISNNLSKIKSFTKGEKYVLRVLASRTALANAGRMISGTSPYNAILRQDSTETLRNPSGETDQELGANSNEKNTVPMTWRSYWDYWENHGDFTNVYPITQGRGIGGILAEYTLENGCYKIVKIYAEFKYGHSTEPLCLEDFPINHDHGENVAYIKDPNIQTFTKEGDNTDTQYCRLAFFKDLLTFDRADQAYGNESLSRRDDVEYYADAHPGQHRQTHNLGYEDDTFYIPLYEKGLGFNIQSNQYKYMVGEIKESITEAELRTKQIALFLKSNGPFAWKADHVKNTIDEAEQDYGYPIKDPSQNWGQTHKIIQDIYIEDVQFFPFKTKKANFKAEVVPKINGYLNGQLKSVNSGQSEQWLEEKNTNGEVSFEGKIFDGDELILPETAPDADAVNRIVWKCYYPDLISSSTNEFSGEFTEDQVTSARVTTNPELQGQEQYLYPKIAVLTATQFGNKLANNQLNSDESQDTISMFKALVGNHVLGTKNIIITGSNLQFNPFYIEIDGHKENVNNNNKVNVVLINNEFYYIETEGTRSYIEIDEVQYEVNTNNQVIYNDVAYDVHTDVQPHRDEVLTNYEYKLYNRIKTVRDNHYEPNIISEGDMEYQDGWKLKDGIEPPSYPVTLDLLKDLIVFNADKYTSITSTVTPDQVDYFYVGTEAPEVHNKNWIPKTNDTFEKYHMLTTKNSNYFDILQKICEGFECWMEFEIEHDEDTGAIKYTNLLDDYGFIIGKKPNKTIKIKSRRGNDRYTHIRSGINLKDATKNSDTTNFATHLIVADNDNEFGENGFCSIARAENNIGKMSELFNFDYFTQTDRIDRNTLINDLYGENGYYAQLAKINEGKTEKVKQLISLVTDLTKLEANVEFFREAYENANAEALEALTNLNTYLDKHYQTVEEGITEFLKIRADNKQSRQYGDILIIQNYNAIDFLGKYNYWQEQYNNAVVNLLELQSWQKQTNERVKALNKSFYNKYSSYIADATWSSNDYVNDDLYYFESQRKLAQAAKPKVTYTFNVISLDQLPGYEAYDLRVGDHLQVIDTDFFGYEKDGITPKKFEVIVTEVSYDLDNPDKTVLKAQNFQDNFTSLFQRITASVNQLK